MRGAKRFSRRPALRKVFRVRADGRFRTTLRSRRLRGRRTLFVVKSRRRPALVARATVR
jgi:hypothetical protein